MSKCNNINCNIRGICYNYLKIKERNEHIIDLYKNSNENTKECDNFIEVEDNDIVVPVTYADKENQI